MVASKRQKVIMRLMWLKMKMLHELGNNAYLKAELLRDIGLLRRIYRAFGPTWVLHALREGRRCYDELYDKSDYPTIQAALFRDSEQLVFQVLMNLKRKEHHHGKDVPIEQVRIANILNPYLITDEMLEKEEAHERRKQAEYPNGELSKNLGGGRETSYSEESVSVRIGGLE